jgi:hypothetical protein
MARRSPYQGFGINRNEKKPRPIFEETAVDACASASEFPGGLAYHPEPRNQTHQSEES